MTYNGAPSPQDIDNHLSRTRTPTPFLSFSGSWRRGLQRREALEDQGQPDIVLIAVWATGLAACTVQRTLPVSSGTPTRARSSKAATCTRRRMPR
ncbi:hypothetical protein BJX96DRAFT_70238 [Aspergillus floccosus]